MIWESYFIDKEAETQKLNDFLKVIQLTIDRTVVHIRPNTKPGHFFPLYTIIYGTNLQGNSYVYFSPKNSLSQFEKFTPFNGTYILMPRENKQGAMRKKHTVVDVAWCVYFFVFEDMKMMPHICDDLFLAFWNWIQLYSRAVVLKL